MSYFDPICILVDLSFCDCFYYLHFLGECHMALILIWCSWSPEALQLLSSLRDVLKVTRIIKFNRIKQSWTSQSFILGPEALQLLFILCFDVKLTHKWQFYNYIRQFLCLMYVYLSQNWSSDGHFDMLNGSKFWLVQKLYYKMQIFPFPLHTTYIKKMKICVFCIFAFFVISWEPIKI